MLQNKPFTKMTPWYSGFKGHIKETDENKFTTYGVYEKTSDSSINITELPIGKWTSDYKEFVDQLLSCDKIKAYQNNSTETDVYFKIIFHNDIPNDVYTFMKLTSTITTSNIHLFDENENIQRFSIESIFKHFIKVRSEFYNKRRIQMIDNLKKSIAENTEIMIYPTCY